MAKLVTQREVDRAAADLQWHQREYGDRNMATERAWMRWHELNQKRKEQQAARKGNPMARKLRVVRNPAGLETGHWIPAHAVRFNEDGTVSMMTEGRTGNRGRRRNVAAGFTEEDTGAFFPFRGSFDYDPARVGEKVTAADRKRLARAKQIKAARKKKRKR